MTAEVMLATCADLPTGDPDDGDLVAALAALGIRGRWADWRGPAEAFADSLTVIRSTWDYTDRREQFLTWADAVPRLANPAPILRWNTDKAYLRELADAGLPVTATQWVLPGQAADLDQPADYVIKPAVGAGSRFAGRFAPGDRAKAEAHLQALHATGATAMVQPYVDAVDTVGEAAMVYLDGVYSHAITKHAMLPPGTVHEDVTERLFVQERIVARVPSAAERAVADDVAAYVRDRFGPLLYTRIDLLPDPAGPVVIELELTEPSLFLTYAEGACDRFAAAIAGRL